MRLTMLWKNAYTSIRVPEDSPLGRVYASKVEEAKECVLHELNHALYRGYRRYRRGKNRCARCGIVRE